MIVVRIELWPGGSKTTARELACMAIANTGAGNCDVGDYTYAISHQEGTKFSNPVVQTAVSALPGMMLAHPEFAWKTGKLDGFLRRKGAVALVAAVLKKAFGKQP